MKGGANHLGGPDLVGAVSSRALGSHKEVIVNATSLAESELITKFAQGLRPHCSLGIGEFALLIVTIHFL